MKNRKLSHNYVIERMRGTGYRMTSDGKGMGLLLLWKGGASQAGLPSGI